MPRRSYQTQTSAIRIVLVYALFSALWIMASDRVMGWMTQDPEWLILLSIGKGFVYIGLSSLLLYILISLSYRRRSLSGDSSFSQRFADKRLTILFLSQIILMPLIPTVLYELNSNQLQLDTKSNLSTLANVKKTQIENWLHERYADALILQQNELFLQSVSLINVGGSVHTTAIDTPVNQLLNHKGYQAVALLNQNNEYAAIFGHMPVHRIQMNTELKNVAHDSMLMSSGITSSWFWNENKQLYLDIRIPLVDPRNHQSIGALILTQDIQKNLLPLIENWPVNSLSGNTYLIQQEAHRVAWIQIPANKAKNSNVTERLFLPEKMPFVTQLFLKKNGFYHGLDFAQKTIFASFQPVDNSGWYLVVQQDESEIYAALHHLIYWVTLIVFLAGILMLFLMSMLWGQQQYTHQLELKQKTDEKDRLLKYFFELPLFGMVILDANNNRLLRFNEQFANLLGYTFDEMTQLTVDVLTTPESKERDESALKEMRLGLIEGYCCEKQLRHKSGRLIDTNIDKRCVRTSTGEIAFIISVVEDITQRKINEHQLNQQRNLYDMLSQTNQAIVRYETKETLLQQICKVAVEHGKFRFAWISAYNETKDDLRVQHIFGDDQGFIELVRELRTKYPIQSMNTGAIQTLRTGVNIVINNYALWDGPSELLEKTQAANIASSAYFILRENGKVIGSLNLYADIQNFFNEEIVATLEEMARDVSFALDNIQRDQQLLQSEERFRQAIMNSPAPALIYTHDGQGLIMNKRWHELTGYELTDIPYRHIWTKLATPTSDNNPWEIKDNSARITTPVYAGEYKIICKNGDIRYWDMHTAPLSTEENDEQLLITTANDITERKAVEEALKVSENQFHTLATFVPVGIFRLNTDGELIYLNQTGQNMLKYQIGQHQSWMQHLITDEFNTPSEWLNRLYEQQESRIECQIITITHETRWVVMNAKPEFNPQQKLIGYIGSITDITELKNTQSQLSEMAHHDALTRLPNRVYLSLQLNAALHHAESHGYQIALLVLDLDRFKDVNDSFGHPIGDALLQDVSNRLVALKAKYKGLYIHRLGGDEFTVLAEDIPDTNRIEQLAADIIQALETPFYLPNGRNVVIGTSIGISLYPDHGKTPEELLQQADAAMYRAKTSGKNCYRYYSEELTRAAEQRLDIEIRLRRAIEQQEFQVYFQPQYNIEQDCLIGAEALIRWFDPEKGMIPPNVFIPAAEESGLIKQIGEWVLAETCRIGARWLQEGLSPIHLAVNISPVQFHYGNLLTTVDQVLKETGFPSNLLELELTETALMSHESTAENILGSLRDLGVRLAIDDFGTGYSSLGYLKRFPLDVLKIDKSFVDDIPDKKDDMEIAATIVAMAKTLRLQVLAEGVETTAQLDFLRSQGCDFYQGYLKHPPMPVEKFEIILKEHSQRDHVGESLHYESP